MDRLFLFLATACFLIAFLRTAFALKSGYFHHSRFNLLASVLGFVFQTVFLGLRGQQIKHCPLTNLFEMLIFLSWSMVLLYLVTGYAVVSPYFFVR